MKSGKWRMKRKPVVELYNKRLEKLETLLSLLKSTTCSLILDSFDSSEERRESRGSTPRPNRAYLLNSSGSSASASPSPFSLQANIIFEL